MAEPIKILQNLLDHCVVKNKVIAKNISNIGTENYKREDVVFRDVLTENVNSLLKTSDQRHISGLSPNSSMDSKYELVEDDSQEMDSGINNVNIEKEMSELAENSLRFKFASNRVSDYFKTIQNVIKSGS
jgi:flagellar basal-body rod protein FlgB